jgi:23S rRNA U2552 (ribose-2'-O)-methylase RlmE/FtsJ
MKSFKLVADKPLEVVTVKKYRLKSLDAIRDKLATVKSQLDDKFDVKKNKMFPHYWKEFDPFRDERATIAVLGNTYNISNAWIKCYEMLAYYDLIGTIDERVFMHFDNAAFPGSFILAAHHYAKTRTAIGNKYIFRASSLFEVNSSNFAPLEDKYKLYTEYKTNWLMSDTNNGDVLVEANQLDFHKRLNDKVNLYTSDLGFDVSSDYNNQELQHVKANIGQILSGLLTLKEGGSFITKQYSFFEPITVSIVYAVASFFKEFHISKPYSSREANSEIYLVGKGFIKPDNILEHPYIKAMFDRILDRVPIVNPIFDAVKYSKTFLSNIITASKVIFDAQIDKILADIERIDKCLASKHSGHTSQHPIVLEFKANNATLLEWYDICYVKPIATSNRLTMTDALGQKHLIY